MTLESCLEVFVSELDRVHKGAEPWRLEGRLPNFTTAQNGLQRHFTQKSKNAVYRFAKTRYENLNKNTINIEFESYYRMVRQVVADLHAGGELSIINNDKKRLSLKKVKELLDKRVERIDDEYTFYFPVRVLGVTRDAAVNVGPVTFMDVIDWVCHFDLWDNINNSFLNKKENNRDWKGQILNALSKDDDASLSGLAKSIYFAIRGCTGIAKVTMKGCELQFSIKRSKLVCKLALDAISLGLGSQEYFLQQTLLDERLPPLTAGHLIEHEGLVKSYEYSIGKSIPIDREKTRQAISNLTDILTAFGQILESVLNPLDHKYPRLSERWANALAWYAEGNRETNDAIALTKLSTCLDILSCGGRSRAIRKMLVNLTGLREDRQVINGDCPRTLREVVDDIYDKGRSRILHGTRPHPYFIERFEDKRNHATVLARYALIECALRLQSYNGEDDEKAFISI